MNDLVPTTPTLSEVDPSRLQNPVAEAAHHSMQAAQHMFEYIAREAIEFQSGLNAQTELGAIMVASGMPKTIHVRQVTAPAP